MKLGNFKVLFEKYNGFFLKDGLDSSLGDEDEGEEGRGGGSWLYRYKQGSHSNGFTAHRRFSIEKFFAGKL